MLESTYENIIKAQQGNTEVLESLVKNNMGLVYNIAKRFVGRGYEIEDLNQIGAMGLVKSIKKFDTNYNVQLSTYAVPFIIGEIKRYIRDDGRIKVSRSIKELAVKINQIQKEAMDKNGEELKVEQIAEILKVSKEEIALALDANSASVVTSINEPVYNDKSGKELCIEDTIASDKDEENKIADKLTIKKLVEELNSQEQEIVMLRYYKGKTQTEVAKKLGISQVQVSRIEKRIFYETKIGNINISNLNGCENGCKIIIILQPSLCLQERNSINYEKIDINYNADYIGYIYNTNYIYNSFWGWRKKRKRNWRNSRKYRKQ